MITWLHFSQHRTDIIDTILPEDVLGSRRTYVTGCEQRTGKRLQFPIACSWRRHRQKSIRINDLWEDKKSSYSFSFLKLLFPLAANVDTCYLAGMQAICNAFAMYYQSSKFFWYREYIVEVLQPIANALRMNCYATHCKCIAKEWQCVLIALSFP